MSKNNLTVIIILLLALLLIVLIIHIYNRRIESLGKRNQIDFNSLDQAPALSYAASFLFTLNRSTMITLRQKAVFRAGFYSITLLLSAFLCIQTNNACAQQTQGAQPRSVLQQLQTLRQQHKNNPGGDRRPNAVSPAKGKSPVNARTYTFTGKGSWFTASNWEHNSVPPMRLKAGDRIVINGAGACVLNNAKPISFSDGSSIEVSTGRQLYITVGSNFILGRGVLSNNGKITILSGTLLQKSGAPDSTGKSGVLKTTSMSKLGRRTSATPGDKQ